MAQCCELVPDIEGASAMSIVWDEGSETKAAKCKFYLTIKHCVECTHDHQVPMRRAEMAAGGMVVSNTRIRFWCSRRQKYVTAEVA